MGPLTWWLPPKKADSLFPIKDYGKGIAPELLDTIFDGGGTSENHTGDGHKGMGIGLSICKTIINAHGGEIHAGKSPAGRPVYIYLTRLEGILNHEYQSQHHHH